MQSEDDLLDAYDHSMDALAALRVRIPEGQFARLKARHLRKVEMSKRISDRPERRPVLHRLDMLCEGLRKNPPK